jgi:chemotaxis protein CheZ
MPMQRKIFRIEEMAQDSAHSTALADDPGEMARHQEIMSGLKALHALLAAQASSGEPAGNGEMAEAGAEDESAAGAPPPRKVRAHGMHKLKIELDVIGEAIRKTKSEMVTLQDSGFDNAQVARIAPQLDAVVEGAEQATRRILMAAEEIDQKAHLLLAAVKNAHEQSLVQDIQDQVTHIFEACNFHDLTGQRINKVSATMRLIEDHITRMTEIWGVIERFGAGTADGNEPDLLAGPKLAGDAGHSSQDEIDALFP